jgi:hypothetical protein
MTHKDGDFVISVTHNQKNDLSLIIKAPDIKFEMNLVIHGSEVDS